MHIVAFVFAVVAAVLFLVAGRPDRTPRNHVALGLFFLVVALVVQFCTRGHTVFF